MSSAVMVGVLVAGGTWLVLHRDLVRMTFGFVLLAHGVNLVLLTAGGTDRRGAPLGTAPDPATTADALPQAFVLTAIVISFGITAYLLALARRAGERAASPGDAAAPNSEASGDDGPAR